MKTFLVLICSLALACAASGAQEENKSKKPAPTKEEPQGTILNPQLKSAQHAAAPSGGDADLRVRVGSPPTTTAGKPNSSQHAVTAGGEPHEKVDSRQLMRQAQHDPAKTKQKMKGSQSQQAAGGHYIGLDHSLVNKSDVANSALSTPSPRKISTKGKPKTETERELMDKLGTANRNSPVGKPSARNLTTNAKPSSEITANAAPPSFVNKSYGAAKQRGGGAGSSAVQLHKFSDTTVKTQREVAGKPAKASKNNNQRATPEYHKVWEDGKLPGGGTGVGKPTANAVTGKPKTKKGEKVSPTPRPQ